MVKASAMVVARGVANLRAVIGYANEIMLRVRAFLLMVLGVVATLGLCSCVTPTLLPIASFTLTPATGDAPLIVTFDASASQSPNGAISAYSWDFGDGTTGQGMITSHLYQTDEATTLTITLTITDHLGQQDSVTADIELQVAPTEVPDESVEFVWPFHFDASGDDAANLNDEYFTLQNTGTDAVDLSGWTVENERGDRFRFPNGVVLMPNAVLSVHSGSGSNTASIFYWNAAYPIWNNDYDLAILRNASGLIITIYSIVSC